MDERSDRELLTAARKGSAAIGVLYERHASTVYRYLSRRVGSDAADDLLGEVFVAALTARERVVPHPAGSALPWLYGIAGNVVRTHLRHRSALTPADHQTTVDWDAVDDRLDAGTRGDELRVALSMLTMAERELLLLVAWEGLSPSEAAAALGLKPVAARSRLHRARMRAQDALDAMTDQSLAATEWTR